MHIGGVDTALSKQIMRRENQKRQHNTYVSMQSHRAGETSTEHIDNNQFGLNTDDNSDNEVVSDNHTSTIGNISVREPRVTRQPQMRLKLSKLARECDKHESQIVVQSGL